VTVNQMVYDLVCYARNAFDVGHWCKIQIWKKNVI